MGIVIILCVSLVIGGLWGFRQVRSHRFSFAVLLTAPVVSTAIIAIVFTMMITLEPRPAILARPLFDRITTYLITGCVYGGGLGLVGAIPALVGSGGTQLLILWARALCAGNRRRGSGDIQAIPAEPGAAGDEPRRGGTGQAQM